MVWAAVISLKGAHAERPAATALPAGALWECTDHDYVYRTDGSTWANFATRDGHGHGDDYSGELLVKDGTTPPEALTLEDQTDYLYEG